MRLRRNLLWWIKISLILLVFLAGTYFTVRQALQDAKDLDILAREVGPLAQASEHKKIIPAEQPIEFNELAVPQGYKDWHDHVRLLAESAQVGPGEHGQAYNLPHQYQHERDQLYKVNGFNARASDDIALNRSLQDIRHPK